MSHYHLCLKKWCLVYQSDWISSHNLLLVQTIPPKSTEFYNGMCENIRMNRGSCLMYRKTEALNSFRKNSPCVYKNNQTNLTRNSWSHLSMFFATAFARQSTLRHSRGADQALECSNDSVHFHAKYIFGANILRLVVLVLRLC